MVGGGDDEIDKDNEVKDKEDGPGDGGGSTGWRWVFCSTSIPQRVTLDSSINTNTLPLNINESI